jgi:hypothetical protein
VLDDAAVFLRHAGQEARHIFERDDRNVEASQKRTKRAALSEASMSSTPASTAGWLATMPTLCPPRCAKPTSDVARVVRLHFVEVAVVDDALEHLAHVVRLFG